nr:DUF3095 domain-containing protein [Oceanicella actignis]
MPAADRFDRLADPAAYRPLPEGWVVGVADVVGSTELIARGRYKAVNMVGAAVIAAMSNALGRRPFPYVFGGDGAGFAVWPEAADAARRALTGARRWAREEFGIELRVALVPAAQIRAAGRDVLVARHRASEAVDYAMFSGGGLAWAEAQMKAGRFLLPEPAPEASPDAPPDLSGLSCRWAHLPARNGAVVSLVLVPRPGADPAAVARVMRAVIALARRLENGGNPAPPEGPALAWPPAGLALEVRARGRRGARLAAWLGALSESLLVWLLLRTGLTLGRFDARRYRREITRNADFRKIDDGLKMTIDCDPRTEARLTRLLERAERAGLIRYGLSRQSEAMITCIVPSAMTADHVHFIDGAGGGYARAASRIKAARAGSDG